MRCGAFLLLAALAGCKIADHDPLVLLAGRAAPDAQDCGHAFGDLEMIRASHACAVAALAEGRPFLVASSPGSADGYSAVGWASANDPDGPRFLRLEYSMTVGLMFPGTDTEEWSWTGCGAIGRRGDDCPSLADDLCFACSSPAAVD